MKNTKSMKITTILALAATLGSAQAVVLIGSAGITASATGPAQSGDFGPEHTLDGLTDEGWQDGDPTDPAGLRVGQHQGTHWITGDITAVGNAITTTISYDLGAVYDLAQIEVLNTSNTAWNDRETNSFTIATSTDGGTTFGAESAAIALQDYTAGFQTIAITDTGVTDVRLTVTNLTDVNTGEQGPSTGVGSDRAVGLNEVRFYEAIPEPSTAVLFGLGSVFLLRRRR